MSGIFRLNLSSNLSPTTTLTLINICLHSSAFLDVLDALKLHIRDGERLVVAVTVLQYFSTFNQGPKSLDFVYHLTSNSGESALMSVGSRRGRRAA